MIEPTTATLAEIRSFVEARMAGSPEPVSFCTINCECEDKAHDQHADGSFCENCIVAACVEQGFPVTDFEQDYYEEWGSLQNCDTCGAFLLQVLDPSAIDDELDHWTFGEHPPNTPEEWREFLLCLPAPGSDAAIDSRILTVITRAADPEHSS